MEQNVLQTLEYDKILAILAEQAGSSLGREQVLLLRPSCDKACVLTWLAETKEARAILDAALSMPLGGVRDIRAMIKRSEIGAVLEPFELLEIGGTLAAARRMKAFFSDMRATAPALAGHSDELITLRQIENLIENTIDKHGAVLDDASVELMRLRREIRLLQNRVKDRLDSILHSNEFQKYFQDVLVTMRGDRYVIPVKQEYRNHFPGIVHDQSASGATVFIEPMPIVALNNDLKQATLSEKSEVERILSMVSGNIARVAQDIQINCRVLGYFDLVNAKARLSRKMKAEMPAVSETGFVNLRQARHPLLAEDIVVPMDIHLGREFDILLITGPNTGGKTVTLKTTGLFALMMQAGLFIPAAYGSEMPVFRSIFADIGDEQSIEQSLSTFSGHMTNLIRILSKVTKDDLVLIDEIGAGTDPDEGAALAMSMLEHLHQCGVKVIATTHYSELKTFAYTRHGIENASVEFDVETLRPTYRLLIGVAGNSNAFAISQRLGLNRSIIERAKHFLSREHVEFEAVLAGLYQQKKEYTARNEEISAVERELKQRKKVLEEEQEQLKTKRGEILSKAKEEASALLRQTRRETDGIIRDLKAQFSVTAEKERQKAVETARSHLRKAGQGIAEYEEEEDGLPLVSAGQLLPGTWVYVPDLKQKGTVISVQGNDVTLQLGIMKINVPISSCRLAEETVQKAAGRAKRDIEKKARDFTVRETSREADVRGLMVEEAITVLDKFLDDAMLAGLNEVSIIHGKGTGALRKGVRSYLANHPGVKSTMIGEFNQGGDGVTVVRLK